MPESFTDLYANIYHNKEHIDLHDDIKLKRLEKWEQRYKKGLKLIIKT